VLRGGVGPAELAPGAAKARGSRWVMLSLVRRSRPVRLSTVLLCSRAS